MNFTLNLVSKNSKTGPMPVSTSHNGTCPDACPLKAKGCYAAYGPTAIHWKKLSNGERGVEWKEFLQQVQSISRGDLWRHNQAGDLVGQDDIIDGITLMELVKANKGRRGFTYTHYPMNNFMNRQHVLSANRSGFTINLSGNNVAHADELADLNIAPVVTILPMDAENVSFTPKGRKVVACPAEKSDKVNCKSCGLCQVADREYIIGFRAHGTAKKTVDLIAKG
ncbi:hypothetical protein K5_154 [Pseudomonas phage K5]|uniref:hypothetical protein n=1 Tax=Pseudomonas phage K8 TaxID=1716041 RepID=UPI0006D30AB6|nr:hypothetical protein K8_155 [Pseudomonas phage K8]YP_009273909.1 hypothetical protein BH773_gp074 [Pseudomonas phage K5]ALF51476.1 hypothetical protein K8_155 [Pseudomonas phage K8]AMD42973.1 hypothetical protein K5_154 [Pseudomonas phage K5]